MSKDHIRYDILMQDSLRMLVKSVLSEISKTGTPGDHYFFITFCTNTKGVIISPKLKADYPEQMTIVLQHQFWDLKVNDELFEICLSFNSQPEKLIIPFKSIIKFIDPSVPFKIEFDQTLKKTNENIQISKSHSTENPKVSTSRQETTAQDKDTASQDNKIISLAEFRKKHNPDAD
ncbi:SspB family protein [Bartonella sp. DGB1]|uniref:SspB family protein n=1 Tax=Bartonella sp. DGB1 TaxID=3239807 RepID=UPI003523977D